MGICVKMGRMLKINRYYIKTILDTEKESWTIGSNMINYAYNLPSKLEQ